MRKAQENRLKIKRLHLQRMYTSNTWLTFANGFQSKLYSERIFLKILIQRNGTHTNSNLILLADLNGITTFRFIFKYTAFEIHIFNVISSCAVAMECNFMNETEKIK